MDRMTSTKLNMTVNSSNLQPALYVKIAAQIPSAPPDFYPPQGKWSHKLGPMSAYSVTVLNQYLAQSKTLNDYPKGILWEAVQEANVFFGGQFSSIDLAAVTAKI